MATSEKRAFKSDAGSRQEAFRACFLLDSAAVYIAFESDQASV